MELAQIEEVTKSYFYSRSSGYDTGTLESDCDVRGVSPLTAYIQRKRFILGSAKAQTYYASLGTDNCESRGNLLTYENSRTEWKEHRIQNVAVLFCILLK